MWPVPFLFDNAPSFCILAIVDDHLETILVQYHIQKTWKVIQCYWFYEADLYPGWFSRDACVLNLEVKFSVFMCYRVWWLHYSAIRIAGMKQCQQIDRIIKRNKLAHKYHINRMKRSQKGNHLKHIETGIQVTVACFIYTKFKRRAGTLCYYPNTELIYWYLRNSSKTRIKIFGMIHSSSSSLKAPSITILTELCK